MQKRSAIAACLLPLTVTGCAYLTNYTSSIDLRNKSYTMDVKQRVVYSQERKGYGNETIRVVCAEPSPDALAVIGASAGGGVTRPGGSVANVTAALAESGAFVGLRTQSIQLLRDTMYRLCEGYAAGAIRDTEFAAMQRRYQSTMMGLLAIEQLTRPVVAAQVVLASSASAQAGASAGDAAVDKAQERVSAAKTAHLSAQTELDKAKTRDQKARKDVKDTQDKLAAENAKKAPDSNVVKSLSDSLPALVDEQTAAADNLRDVTRREQAAAATVKEAEIALRNAQSKVTAAASGSGQLGAVREASAQMTADLTDGVVLIVREINRSYTRDGCFSLIERLVSAPPGALGSPAGGAPATAADAVTSSSVISTSLELCKEILAEEVKAFTAQGKSADPLRLERSPVGAPPAEKGSRK